MKMMLGFFACAFATGPLASPKRMATIINARPTSFDHFINTSIPSTSNSNNRLESNSKLNA
jgi:hypothetical protein